MLYDWLAEIGISKEQAQDLFIFDAVFDRFTGHGKEGHLVPDEHQMEDYWERGLKAKVIEADKIWLLGNVANNFIVGKKLDSLFGKNFLLTMHPSKRNSLAFGKVKKVMLERIRNFTFEI